MADNQRLSISSQEGLDHVLRGLVDDLQHVIPEHEIVLSLVSATQSALMQDVPEHDIPGAVDTAVRRTWTSLTALTDTALEGAPHFEPFGANGLPGPAGGVGLLQLDADMRIAALDKEARRVLGTGGAGVTGTSVLDLVSAEYRPAADEALRAGGRSASRVLVVPLQSDGRRHALLATAPVSGTAPLRRACAVARLPEVPTPRRFPDAPRKDDHCLIECIVTDDLAPVELPAIGERLRAALGEQIEVLADHGRIAVLLPALGTIAALQHAERVAHLMRDFCLEDGIGDAQIDTTMVCVGSPLSLRHLLYRVAPTPVW